MDTIHNDMSYRDWIATQSGTTNQSSNVNNQFDAVFVEEKEQTLSVNDFLSLMVAELQNQDFLNPVDNSQYVAQMAQFATLQQMQELAEYSKTNYAVSLVGKNVTAAKYTVSGNLEKVTGMISKVSLVDSEYKVFIGDKSFSLSQIMELNQTPSTDNTVPPSEDKDEEDGKNKPEETPSVPPSGGSETPKTDPDSDPTTGGSDAVKDPSDETADPIENNTDPSEPSDVTDSGTENSDPAPSTDTENPNNDSGNDGNN